MKLNQSTILYGKIINVIKPGNKINLVPYKAHHVPIYHEWMKLPDLLEMTASEPLTLDQEYAMQQSWLNDPDSMKNNNFYHPSIMSCYH